MPTAQLVMLCRKALLIIVVLMLHSAWLAVTLYASTWYWKQPYHTNALSGEAWVNELIFGHLERIYTCLGMRVHVFLALVPELCLHGLKDSHYVTLKEKVAISVLLVFLSNILEKDSSGPC